jgi:ribulose bisphosphate carboxylase small subunit
MKVSQGQLSVLPDLSEAEIRLQVHYALDQGQAPTAPVGL